MSDDPNDMARTWWDHHAILAKRLAEPETSPTTRADNIADLFDLIGRVTAPEIKAECVATYRLHAGARATMPQA